MTKIIKNNILQGVLITLISAMIIGSITVATDFYITKQKQELINQNNSNDKTQLNRLYRITVNRMNRIDDKVDNFNEQNVKQHNQLTKELSEIKYVIIKNNKEMKRDLKELKQANLITDK